MIPFNLLTPTRHGFMVANVHDQFISRSLIHYGEFSELEVAFLLQFVSRDLAVLDIGANIGALTVPFARKAGVVFACEPQRACFQSLCANLALNSLKNVWAYQYAIGATCGVIRVPNLDPGKAANFGGAELSPTADGDAVHLLTIDALSPPKASLMKIDVEGMEADVLEGARGYIAEHKPVLYVEADRGEKRAALLNLLRELGYDVYRHEPMLFNPDNFRGDPVNIFPNTASINVLALPAGRLPPEGLERAV